MFWPELLGQALEPDQTARAKTWRKCPGLERVQSSLSGSPLQKSCLKPEKP